MELTLIFRYGRVFVQEQLAEPHILFMFGAMCILSSFLLMQHAREEPKYQAEFSMLKHVGIQFLSIVAATINTENV